MVLSLIFRWAPRAMLAHRLCHCALCLKHTTLPQQTPLRNSPSRSFYSCVLPNTPSGEQFHSDFMKISVKDRPPATQETRWPLFGRVLRALRPLQGSPAASPACFRMHLLRLPPHSNAFADATTQHPLTEFFLGCVYSNDSLDRQPTLPSQGNLSGAPLHLGISSTSGV